MRRDLPKLLLALGVCLCMLLQGSVGRFPITPKGVHCPTAAIQVVPDSTTGHPTLRKPKPGDSAFVQCCCAEKKASQQLAQRSGRHSSELMAVALIPDISELPSWSAADPASDVSKPTDLPGDLNYPPLTPPPDVLS